MNGTWYSAIATWGLDGTEFTVARTDSGSEATFSGLCFLRFRFQRVDNRLRKGNSTIQISDRTIDTIEDYRGQRRHHLKSL